MLWQANCSLPAPATTPSDAGVAGVGVLLSFMVPGLFALVLSAVIIYQEVRGRDSILPRKLLQGYSDQQIMTGISIQAIGLAKAGTIVPYHFFLVWMLSLLSMATHNASLLALVRDFRRDWVLRWLRQALMFTNLALGCVSGIFVLKAVQQDLPPTLPIACVWEAQGAGGAPGAGLSYVGTTAVIGGNACVFALATWYLHSRSRLFHTTVQLVGLALMATIATGAVIRIVLLSQAFGTPSVALADDGEQDWSFGQLLGLLLILFPLVSVVEIVRGEISVAPPVDDDAAQPLDDDTETPPIKEVESDIYQPNPFFGSDSSLFRKR